MKNLVFLLLTTMLLFACTRKNDGKLEKDTSIEQSYYNNPILAGWYPDPSITDDGNGNYYLVNSTFSFYPGIPVFHSLDLVNWKQIGHVLDRPEQLELEGLEVSEGIFAPDISYDKGLFYVTCTVVGGKGNFVVYAKNPEGPWSNPVWLPEVKGIDPGLFFDDEKSYIIYNSDAPNNEPLYQGHRTIRMYEFDKENLKVIGDNRILVNGGVDISKKPIWAEGPRIYKINGYYYLMTAEGGTAIDHSEVVYRNTNINDDFIPYEDNPILTQRQLDPNRKNPITSAGHADIVQTENGEWYGVFLATRDYDDDHYNTGRETFLTPVKWVDNWPVFELEGDIIKYQYPLPKNTQIDHSAFPLSGNFTFKEDFDSNKLGFNWLFLRTVKDAWYNLNENPGFLSLRTRQESIQGKSNPSFIGHRQQHQKGSVSVKVVFSPENMNESAGIVAFQNESNFYYLCKTMDNGKEVVQLQMANEQGISIIASEILKSGNQEIKLKIEADTDRYHFYYSTGDDWNMLKDNVDGKYLSTKVAKGFVGVTFGMYTTSNGVGSTNTAHFDWFNYEGYDAVFNTPSN